MEKGQIVRLTIEDMSTEGQGIGKIYEDDSAKSEKRGFPVFVKGAVVGDCVDTELTKVKKNYAFGQIRNMVQASEDRIEPYCEYNGICGGCTLGALRYEAQLALKERQVRDKLVRLGGLEDPVIMPIMGMNDAESGEEPFRYRNKAGMPVSTGGLITKKAELHCRYMSQGLGFTDQRATMLWTVQTVCSSRSLQWRLRLHFVSS